MLTRFQRFARWHQRSKEEEGVSMNGAKSKAPLGETSITRVG